MKTIVDLLLVALITIYIVDLSGFSDTILDFVSGWCGRKVTELKPFTCSLCMVWWVCIIYLIVVGQFSLPMVAVSALLSYLSVPIGQLLSFIKESFLAIVCKLTDKL